MNRAAERIWKHRFAQTLYETFCASGIDRAAALDDAYAHADAQYLVRGLNTPEEEARSALIWIQSHMAPAVDAGSGNGIHPANPHNGTRQAQPSKAELLIPDLSE